MITLLLTLALATSNQTAHKQPAIVFSDQIVSYNLTDKKKGRN